MIDFKYAELNAWENDLCPHGAVRINWGASKIGFGQLDVVFDKEGRAHFYTEHMCDILNKNFLKDLFMKIIEDGVVED